ncbi:MAG: hypothetical protein SLRJCFUN_002344 [Candidatus Fervidibacter sp.]
MVEKKEGQVKRREWLFKAAEAAALALFGTMGLKEVTAAVIERVREKMEEREVSNLVAQELSALSEFVGLTTAYYYGSCGSQNQSCSQAFECDLQTVTCGSFACGNIGQPYHCGPNRQDFDCYQSFTCKVDFGCQPSDGKFDCNDPDQFKCSKTFNCGKYAQPIAGEV